MERSKYRLVIYGLELAQLGKTRALNLFNNWLWDSGALNVASGVVRSETDVCRDAVAHTIYFDSSYWTGLKTS